MEILIIVNYEISVALGTNLKSNFMRYLFTLLGFSFLFNSCSNKAESIHPTQESITQSVYASGVVKSRFQYEVYPKVSGTVESILISEGEAVNKGQAIIKLSNTANTLNYENAKLAANYSSLNSNKEKLTQAATEYELAKEKAENESSLLERQKKLWDQEIGTKNELDQRALSYKNAVTLLNASKLKLEDLKKQLDFQTKQAEKTVAISEVGMNDFIIKSQINGKVYSINKKLGELATPQSALAIIGDNAKFFVELQVDEYDIAKIKIGQRVFIGMDSYKGTSFEAVISKIYPIMNERLKSFKVEADFVTTPENVMPNLSAQANIVIQVKEKTLTIPRSYLIDNEFVYLINKEKRKVKVGLMDYDKVEILAGLNLSDALVKSVQ